MAAKKPQLRRCGNCKSVGHNRATCPNQKKSNSSPKSAPAPLKFFIHHVHHEPPTSPHVVNLKSGREEVWQNIESVAPEQDQTPFQTYHTRPSENFKVSKELFTDLGYKNPPPLFDEDPGAKINFNLKNFSFKFPSRKTLAGFAMAALIFFLPVSANSYYQNLSHTKSSILDNSTAGFMALQESTVAIKSANLLDAGIATKEAMSKFNSALTELESKHTILQTIVSAIPVLHGELESRQRILLAGQEIAVGNSYIISALQTIEAQKETSLTTKLETIMSAVLAAKPNYSEALKNLQSVNIDTLPVEYQDRFQDFKTLFSTLIGDFDNLLALKETIYDIFGGEGERKYLLVFQNPHEIRPTGGFAGSFAILTVKDGKITDLQVPPGGSYDLQGQLLEKIVPPTPLLLSNKRWEFQDANWFPEFSASAEKMLWFYDRSWKQTADGVIAINATVLERILGVIGPLSDESRKLTLTTENAIGSIQQVVEEGPEKKLNQPKKILADLAPKILLNIQNLSPHSIIPLLSTLQTALEEKEIQAYFKDNEIQKNIVAQGWAGRIAEAKNSDYLMVVNSNLQSEKSDAKIKQSISYEAVISDDGTITNTVIVTRKHEGIPGEKFYGKTNIDYLRVYVPEGSTMISASGFTWPDEKLFRVPEQDSKIDQELIDKEIQMGVDEQSGTRITKEFGKTVFGNWVVTQPGEVSRAYFTYQLPFKIKEINKSEIIKLFENEVMPFQIIIQKQSGVTSDFDGQIIFPDSWSTQWQKGVNIIPAKNGMLISNLSLTRDLVWSVLMKKH